MQSQPTPAFLITPMRVLTMPELTFFFVASQPVAFADLDQVLDPLLESLYAARTQAHITMAGPDIVRYYGARAEESSADSGAESSDQWLMEVGMSVDTWDASRGRRPGENLTALPLCGPTALG